MGCGRAGDEPRAAPGDGCYECGVCGWIYDPAAGDAVWPLAPGTPFAALPAHWCCPNCEAPKGRFLRLPPPEG